MTSAGSGRTPAGSAANAQDVVALAVSGSNLSGDVPYSAALRLGAAVHGRSCPAGERGDLAQLCAELCAAHAVQPERIGELRIDVGPGSYTGLRVAVTFVRFLQAFGVSRVFAVDSLALLALRGLAAAGADGRVRPMLDARRGRYHSGVYTLADGRLTAPQAAAAAPTAEVLAQLAANEVVVVPASLATQLGDALAARCREVVVAHEVVAAELFAPELPLVPAAAADLEPRYLMASYAEQ